MQWPSATGTLTSGASDVLCIGPTDWLVIGPDPDPTPLLRILSDAFQGTPFRATNVSSALTRIRIEGPDVRMLLSKACALDFRPQVFPPRCLARTRFAGVPVVVRCLQPSVFDCIVSVSYGDYLMAWLSDASTECEVR
jgi:sarcosine oxidase subunit gamma